MCGKEIRMEEKKSAAILPNFRDVFCIRPKAKNREPENKTARYYVHTFFLFDGIYRKQT